MDLDTLSIDKIHFSGIILWPPTWLVATVGFLLGS